jgi:hypothetical protein
MAVWEFVKRVIQTALQPVSSRRTERKIAAVREATRYNFPTADLTQMLAEIEGRSHKPNPS